MLPMIKQLLERAKQVAKVVDNRTRLDEYRMDMGNGKKDIALRYYTGSSKFGLDFNDGKGVIPIPSKYSDLVRGWINERINILDGDRESEQVKKNIDRISVYLQSIRE